MASIPQSGIYLITCKANSKQYVGSAVNLQKRWHDHCRDLRENKHHNPYLQRAWKKYGERAFEWQVLEYTSKAQLIEREQYWIDILHTVKPSGFNICPVAGSTLGKQHSLEARAKMSETRKKLTPRKQTPEERAKRSATMRGKKKSPEHIEKMRASQLGKKRPYRDANYREKISKAHKGRKHTPEHAEKVANTKRKTYIVTSPDGIETTIHGMRRFCREYGLCQSNMTAVAKGKKPHHKGWKCRHAQ